MQPETEPRHAPRWMKVLLGVSLALNFLVLGAVLGALAFGERRDVPRGGDRTSLSAPLMQALPQADQRALRRALLRDREALRGSRQEIRAARDEMIVALRQDPFDRSAFAAALETQLQSGQALFVAGQTALVEHLANMSATEREAYAERLEDLMTRRRPPRD